MAGYPEKESVKNNSNIISGVMYFYIHFVTEVLCFYTLYTYTGTRSEVWLFFLAYDMLAFVPQALIGRFSDRFPKLPLGAAGLIFLAAALLLFQARSGTYLPLTVLCLGNCMVHVNGAEVTLRTSGGKLAGSAIFVSGGSFGVVTGRLMGSAGMPDGILFVLALTALPLTLLAQRYILNDARPQTEQCRDFRYIKGGAAKGAVIALAVVIVAVRGYMGYGIPTSWNKTLVQLVMLFSFMGTGKALGGIFADRFGFRRTAMVSTALAAPLLMFGDNIMAISLIGVMLFSMTMAITLGLIVSAIPKTPGLAFGWTTIRLFMGTAPAFFFRLRTTAANCIMIAALSILCLAIMWLIIRKDPENE